ncbi:Deoxycytidine monophosphate (dCMP) deaminase [Diplodia seriata]
MLIGICGDVQSLIDFVTKKWQDRWVTTDIWDEDVVDALLRRPFFLLVSVDAPVTLRWERFKARPSLSSLRAALAALDLPNESRLRPAWDQYFMQLASLAAQRSNCMKRRVGCVLVRERRVVSTGYNGTPRKMRNCNEGGCPRCNAATPGGSSLATCFCLHAEENALLEAGRERIREGSILYCDTCPCLTCSIKITQVGISEVVYSQAYSMDVDSAKIFEEGGVTLRQFVPPRDGLVDLGELDVKRA